MKILVSAGPTREKIDPVRFISNRSSGKMGYALAEAALTAGHCVCIVSGPVALKPPPGAEFVPVESAAEMASAMREHAKDADLVIMAAAVADYRPVSAADQKIKKSEAKLSLELERTEDILASLGKNKKPSQILVGFAAETSELVAHARAKLEAKNLDWIIANDVSRPSCGFDSDTNAVTMLSRDGRSIELPLSDKKHLAIEILKILGL
ncbi:MAG: hypothetical protein A2X49_08540 [Lentisphaerae bacterium GWF2_52_8]|nr:MAG: hypothetical protein A2X49_08540 [Lentisphaerae bacterium GWF2_52_8]